MGSSCKKDDNTVEVTPPESLDDQVIVEGALIKEYLQTHFYNYEEFENPSEGFDYRIVIDTIAGDNADKEPLFNHMATETISVASTRFGIDDDIDVDHTYYYLEAEEGMGNPISVADSIYVVYEGSLLNGDVFNAYTSTPIWFDLGSIQGGGARGFTEGASNFKVGGTPILNEDGSFFVEGKGAGLVIFPSALGYYNAPPSGIGNYSPLIFKMELYAVNITDHDGDGIPSILEDLDGDGYLYNDNTDADDETTYIPDFADNDDDNDGIATREEISDENGNLILNPDDYPDSNGDDVPDYRDKNN